MRVIHLGSAVLVCGSLALAACGSSSSSSGSTSGPVKIGASIPLSGPLAGFGSFQKWGYQHAIDAANAKGGVTIDGKKRKLKLVLLDDKTDPNTTSANTTRLITRDKVDGLLGSCTPALVNAGALIAERNKKPMVTGCDPVLAFTGVKQWTHVWDLFFSESNVSGLPFKTLAASGLQTNKTVAVLHDNGPDGTALGKAWPAAAKAAGYKVAANESFPTDATQFSSLVQKAKASGADIVLVDSVTPQAVSIRKQMASAGFTPKVLVMEKGAEPVQFQQALGSLAQGVQVGGYWDPTFPFPGASTLAQEFTQQTGQSSSQHIADSDAAASILIDALNRAGSTDPEKLNAAIAKTNGTYVVGPVRFGANHASVLPSVSTQWQGKTTKVVGSPTGGIKANGKLIALGAAG